MRWIIAVLILVIGCTLFLIPGVLAKPGVNDATANTSGDAELDAIIGDLLDIPAADANQSNETASADSSLGLAEIDLDSSPQSQEAIERATVFPETQVQRLDITIDAADWQAMQDEVASSRSGMAGEMRADMGQVPEDMPGMADRTSQSAEPLNSLCENCQAGDAVIASMGFQEIEGTCVEQDGSLIFEPVAGMMPAPGLAGGGMRPGVAGMEPEVPAQDAPPQRQIPGGMRPDVAETNADTPPQDAKAQRQMPGGIVNGLNETADADLNYVSCTVAYEGQTWNNVGIRFKGNSTLSGTIQAGSLKYPLHLDFDWYEDLYPETLNQRFFGFDDLSLYNGVKDSTLLRNYVSTELFSSFGVPVSEAAYYQVYLDTGEESEYLGLYVVIETPDDPMLELQFGDSDGNLYKPQGGSATWETFDTDSLDKKTNEEEADWSDLEAMFSALHASQDDAATWRSNLEAVFDVDGFLRWLAINQLLANWDSYGQSPQNYYLYTSSSDELVHWMPWDLNESLSATSQRFSLSIDLDNVGDKWPLIRYLLDDPIYHAAYTTYIAEALDTVFDAEALETLIRETYAAIAPYITDTDGALSEYSFLSSIEATETAVEQLIAKAKSQISAAQTFLDQQGTIETPIVISEILYNPSPNQGPDDKFEFIELYNRGDLTVDLSNWRFDDGIVCTLPEGIELAPGERLILAKDASTYTNLGCQVVQWESGKLANEGEALRLVNSDGFWVDCVTYDDRGLWTPAADGDGSSLELVDPDSANHMSAAWAASMTLGGTPGI